MSEPFLAEIRMVGFNFAPRGYAACDGQLLPISQNQALFSLLGTIYGGDGRTSFALPDMRGRMPVHKSGNRRLGSVSGSLTTTSPLSVVDQLQVGRSLAVTRSQDEIYNGSDAFSAPYSAINFCIALTGIFPSRS